MSFDPVRNAAIDVLLRVVEKGAHVDAAIEKKFRRQPISPRGKRFMAHLVYGTVRHMRLCDHLLTSIVEQPLEKLPTPILFVLRMGIFQALFSSQVTRPALVHTSVELAKRRGHVGTARLVNACLRRAPTALTEVVFPDKSKDILQYLHVRYSIPVWLASRWVQELGNDDAEELCRVSNEESDVSLRVNTLKTDADALMRALAARKIDAVKRTVVPEEVTVEDTTAALLCPLFRLGHYIVQDPASMMVSHLLEPCAGERILDMCAAPGGKTTHIAQLTGEKAFVVAMDSRYGRLNGVIENEHRLGLRSCFKVCGDGACPPLRGEQFDRVLVDAPCSGLGTLQRHPDIKLRASQEEPERLHRTQVRLLHSAIELCKNSGLIVYSVCTTTREETDDVAEEILRRGDVQTEDGPPWLSPWRKSEGRYSTLPSRDGMDGFFLMRLRKRS